MLEPTDNFGFTTVGPGETLSKNGHAALTSDRSMLDSILFALTSHTHGGGERLASPTLAPDLSVEQGDPDAMLPGNRTYYYRYSFVDRYGLETAASPEAEITTPPGASGPTAPTLLHEPSGGTLNAGRYAYRITFSDYQGGETGPSDVASIVIESTSCSGTCRILLGLPEAPVVAPCINIYRARQGQTRFFFLAKVEGTQTFYDDGSITEDQSITPPVSNTTGGQNRIDITVPSLPEDVVAWRIYRAQSPGGYGSASLVHHVVEGTEESASDLLDTWSDRGMSLGRGTPRMTSSTLAGTPVLRLDQFEGLLRLDNLPRGATTWDLHLPSTLESKIYGRHTFTTSVRPFSISAYFLDAPQIVSGSWVKFFLEDAQQNRVSLEAQSNDQYHFIQFPTTEGEFLPAEFGGRSSGVPIVNDADALTNQAARITLAAQFVLVETVPLDAGTYRAWVRARRVEGALLTNDLQLSVRRVSDASPIITATVTLHNEEYVDIAFPDFPVVQGEAVFLRVDKLLEEQIVFYNIDAFWYEPALDVLDPGEISMGVEVGGFHDLLARDGSRQGGATLEADATSDAGEVVELAPQDSYVEMVMPSAPPAVELDARVRVRTDGGGPVEGLRLTAHRADTSGVLSTIDVTPNSNEYAWFDFAPFTPSPSDVGVFLRVTKVTSDVEPYYVDWVSTRVDAMHPGGDVQIHAVA